MVTYFNFLLIFPKTLKYVTFFTENPLDLVRFLLS